MRAASIGECMLEISGNSTTARIGFGGDTLNTAVYLARLGVPTDYATALGEDPFSLEMIAAWEAEGVGTQLVTCLPGRQPGLYVIRTDENGERRFYYWRQQAPARQLFELPEAPALCESLRSYDLIYFSGITLSLYTAHGRATLLRTLAEARNNGARVAFDPNYRPAGWPNAQAAATAFSDVMPQVDIVLPSLDDEDQLHADQGVAACLDRLRQASVTEAVIKRGAAGCVVLDGTDTHEVSAQKMAAPIDTTAAGDSFNAGYLAGRLRGLSRVEAAEIGKRLAAAVVQHPGAIIPRDAMPGDLFRDDIPN